MENSSLSGGEESLNVSETVGEERFCSGDEHVANCVSYIDQELLVLGLPSVLKKGSSTELNLPDLLNTVHRLLRLHHSDQLNMEELRTSLQRGRSDVLMQTEIADRLKDDLRSADKELAGCQEKERQLNIKMKSLSAKLRAEQDEVRRLKTSMQYKETQYSHEMRKREKEYSRLKVTLGQMVSDRSRQRQLSLSVLNALQRAGGKRKLWNQPGSSVEETYRAIVNSYEERQKAILVENGSLRESLSVMQRELVSLLNEQQRARVRKPPTTEEEEFGEGLSSGHFQMPYDIVRDGVERTFRDHLQKLREQLQLQTATQRPAESEEKGGGEGMDVATLQSKLSDYRDIIGKQEQMLREAETAVIGGKEEGLSESWVWREREKVEEDKTEVEEQRERLEKDRHALIEAAKKLDRERQMFEDDKVSFLKEQFLDSSVFNNTTELDSFYGRLSSTPAAATSSGSTHSSAQVDLRHDLSLCSDDGLPDVLNDSSRPEVASDDTS